MNCEGRCTGKCKLLGGLEQKIINILWSSDVPLKPAQVLSQLNEDYAYTTVMTVLKRMSNKGLLKRQLQVNTFLYSAAVDRETFTTQCLDDLFKRLFQSYGGAVVPAFVKHAKEAKIDLTTTL